MKQILAIIFVSVLFSNCGYAQPDRTKKSTMDNKDTTGKKVYSTTDTSKVELKEDDWKKILTPEQYYIARQKGTERPWTSKFEKHDEVGLYRCVACGNALFRSNTKFDSGCGWPSFYEPKEDHAVELREDNSHGMKRVEVLCRACGSHLGHVFEDAPQTPTGDRYCINSVSITFEEK